MGVAHLLTACAALGGIPTATARSDRALSGACPKCKRGKIQGGSGAHYCHRCGWFLTAGDTTTVLALDAMRAELAK